MKSKVMAELSRPIEKHLLRSQEQVADMIRAAIKEFAEMANVRNMAGELDADSQYDAVCVDHLNEALAAFGVEKT